MTGRWGRAPSAAIAYTDLADAVAASPRGTIPCRDGGTPDAWIDDEPHTQRDAARVCTACPLRDACRTYAVTAREPAGVWGGLTAEERPGTDAHHNRQTRMTRRLPATG